MRKQFILENLDCGHCAMEMEEEAKKIPGVLFVNVNFLSMKLTLEAEDKKFRQVFRAVEKACLKVEPDLKISERKRKFTSEDRKEIFWILLSAVLFLAVKILQWTHLIPHDSHFASLFYLPSYLIAGAGVLRKAIHGLFHKRWFDENFLMTLATLAAFSIAESGEAVTVMLLYRIGEFMQDLAVKKSRKNITDLMDLRPDHVHVMRGESEETVSPEDVPAGSIILIKPGEKIPLDGTVLRGESSLDTASLTGESLPRSVKEGDPVLAGFVNMNSPLTVQTDKTYSESSVAKILEIIENSGEKKSQAERFISRFARYYTPAVVLLSLGVALIPPLFTGAWSRWIYKAISCLVISCPCALVISVPLAFFGGIGGAGSRGILIKGADSLEKLAKAEACAFDKTGTLTKGNFGVTAIHPDVMSEKDLLELAVTCEHYSNHPISHSLKAAYHEEINQSRIGKITEISGEGIIAIIDGNEIYVGNEVLMKRAEVEIAPCEKCREHAGTTVHLAERNHYLGHIVVSDTLKFDAQSAVAALREEGIKEFHLISGDKEEEAMAVGKELLIFSVYAPLLPHEKAETVKRLNHDKKRNGTFLFVGDGINDAPVLMEADLGIAMGGIGADAAMEASDIVLMDDSPSKIAMGIRFARKTLRIVWQNIVLSIGIKLTVLIPSLVLSTEIPLWWAIFADVGVCILAILNSARALRLNEKKQNP